MSEHDHTKATKQGPRIDNRSKHYGLVKPLKWDCNTYFVKGRFVILALISMPFICSFRS
jgi:hypothetical protein